MFFVESKENPICPVCSNELTYRCRRRRIWKQYGGETRWLRIRKMFCGHCQAFHDEIPDCISPHKHYGTTVIEDAVDEITLPDDENYNGYPCERTMQRWSKWIGENKTQIDGTLKSIGSRLPDFGNELLESVDSLLDKLREDGAGWLSTINRIIYNSGNRIIPGAVADLYLLCHGVNRRSAVCSPHKEVMQQCNQKNYKTGRTNRLLTDSG